MPHVKIVEVTWERAFKVWWSLMWRGMLFGFLGGFVISFVLGSVMTIAGLSPETIQGVCRIAGAIVGIPIGIAVTKIVLKKKYSDFKVALISEQ
jgi:hypothetical protein